MGESILVKKKLILLFVSILRFIKIVKHLKQHNIGNYIIIIKILTHFIWVLIIIYFTVIGMVRRTQSPLHRIIYYNAT